MPRNRAIYRNGWTIYHLIGALALMALGVGATFPAWADIYLNAHLDDEQSHILLVAPVVAWLVWVRRQRFRNCQPRGSFVGPAFVALGWLISTWGYRNSTQSLWHGGAVVVVVGCLITIVGRDVLMRFLPAFFVIVFLVPIPQRIRLNIAIPLQTATATVTQKIFDVVGQPIDRDQNLLSINGKPVAVAEACNGMRMVFALVMVSYAFAFGEPLRSYVRFLILVASPISALFCNVLRMAPLVWLYGHAPKEIADFAHDKVSPWVMLAAAFLLLMGIISILKWALIPVHQLSLASE